ncbi:DNA mismatch repair protein MutL, partial [Stenotrophomonas maltophilia]
RAAALPPMPSENGLPVTSADAGVPPLGYAIAQPAAYAALYATPAGAERAAALPPMPSENGLPVTSADAGVPPLGYAIAQ